MGAKKCKCGEPLITFDERKLQACWGCAGISWRLEILDRELAKLERAANRPWEPRPRFVYAGSG